jgi:ADP-ribosylglycohydrolase
MRTPAAFLANTGADEENLAKAIIQSCLPTHNSAAALEAAVAFGFALRSAAGGATKEGVIEAALRGAALGAGGREDDFPPPSTAARIGLLAEQAPRWKDPGEAITFIHDVLGAGLPSWELGPAVFGVFLFAGADTWLSVRMGASMGGDTDTLAAMAGALSAVYAGSANLPADIVEAVSKANALDLPSLARRVAAAG